MPTKRVTDHSNNTGQAYACPVSLTEEEEDEKDNEPLPGSGTEFLPVLLVASGCVGCW